MSMGPEPAPTSPPIPSNTDRPTVIIRYGAMGLVGRFVHAMEHWRCGQQVVIKSDRGQEIGSIVCGWGGCGSPGGVSPQIRGEVLRPTTHTDEVEARHLADSERREFLYCKQCIAARNLPMKLVAAEHLFGGDRIVFYFVSEARVDFRALVRDLAHEFQTRIEMRQIGVRDEARLLGDYERCGRPLCCRTWIKELEPVSMKMAKVQKATLDPTKISGRCGRLMCCLRYEHATYRELSANLPRKNTLVMTPDGPAKVIDTDIMTQMVGVLLSNGNRANVPVELITPAGSAAAKVPDAVAMAEPEIESMIAKVEALSSDESVSEAPAEELENPPEVPAAPAGPTEVRPDPSVRPPRQIEQRGRAQGRGEQHGRPNDRGDRHGRPDGRGDQRGRPEGQGGQRREGQGGRPEGQGSQRREEQGSRPEGQVAPGAPAEGQGGHAGQPSQAGQPGQPGQGGQEGRSGRRGRRRSRRGGRNRGGRSQGGGPGGPAGQNPPTAAEAPAGRQGGPTAGPSAPPPPAASSPNSQDARPSDGS
jgi:cell fate regulator YaaT (PSP1 superfamily)